MKILVTGGAGFIGHAVVANLEKQGHDVCILDNFTNYGIIPEQEITALHTGLQYDTKKNQTKGNQYVYIRACGPADTASATEPEIVGSSPARSFIPFWGSVC